MVRHYMTTVTYVKHGLFVLIPSLVAAAVLDRFPHLSQANFGSVVNSFLGPQANVIHEMEVSVTIAHLYFHCPIPFKSYNISLFQFVEQSDSEPEDYDL